MTTDVNQMQTGVNMVLRLLLRSPFVVFGATIMAFTVNARAALIFLALLPLLTLTVVGITKLTLPRYQKVQGQLDKVLLHTRENVTGLFACCVPFGCRRKKHLPMKLITTS